MSYAEILLEIQKKEADIWKHYGHNRDMMQAETGMIVGLGIARDLIIKAARKESGQCLNQP